MPLNDFRRPSIRFIIITCILCLYVILPQLTNLILAWGNVTRMVENIASVNFSLMALYKLVGTWYHGESKLSFRKYCINIFVMRDINEKIYYLTLRLILHNNFIRIKMAYALSMCTILNDMSFPEALRTLMTSCMTDWITSKNNQERNTMLNVARRGRSLSLRCYVFVTVAILFYLFLNFRKFYGNMHQPQRNLVYHFSYPYNSQKSPNYEITFFVQLSGGIYSAIINCTIDSFVSMLLLHICAQLINLRAALNNLVDELANGSISSPKFKQGLAAIIMSHERLIRYVEKFRVIIYYREIFLNIYSNLFIKYFKIK